MTTPQWTADIEIDVALATATIAARFPALAKLPVEAFGHGWDNAAFLVDGRIVFRFPRRKQCAKLIEREIALVPDIAERVPLPISAPTYAGAATEAYPWRFAGYPLLRGTAASSRPLTDTERANLAVPLATFLRALHAIDARPLVARGLPPDEIGRLDHAKRLDASQARVATIAASGLASDVETFVVWLANNPAVPMAGGRHALVHGDLYALHLLLDDDARPSGIIDWGDVHAGDPAIDLSIAHMVLPERAHAAFREAYGAIDERTWNVARYRAIYHAILEIDYGIRADDASMRESGTTALALMRAAVHRRENRATGSETVARSSPR